MSQDSAREGPARSFFSSTVNIDPALIRPVAMVHVRGKSAAVMTGLRRLLCRITDHSWVPLIVERRALSERSQFSKIEWKSLGSFAKKR